MTIRLTPWSIFEIIYLAAQYCKHQQEASVHLYNYFVYPCDRLFRQIISASKWEEGWQEKNINKERPKKPHL